MAVRRVPDIQEWGPDVRVDGAMEQARPGAGASWATTLKHLGPYLCFGN
jgi:hypothetical protein